MGSENRVPRPELAELRRRGGWSQPAFADRLNVSVQSIRQWEQGVCAPLPRYRPRIAEALGISLPEVDRILDGRPADHGQAIDVGGPGSSMLVKAEQGASRVELVDLLRIPALLQTREYGAAVESTFPLASRVPADIDRTVDRRLARQAALHRDPDPLELTALIPRWVLRRIRGSRTVMADQLGHLLDVAELPNVDVRVLPESPGAADLIGTLTIITGRGSIRPDLVGVDSITATTYVEDGRDVAELVAAFQQLDAEALTATASADLIHHQRKEYRE